MRQRHNRAAVCSSDNYRLSRVLHADFLKEKHSHFNEMLIDGKLTIHKPIFKNGRMTGRGRKITVLGHHMVVTEEEYRIHCAHLNIK